MYPTGIGSNSISFDIESGVSAPQDLPRGVKQEKQQALNRGWSNFAKTAIRSEEAGTTGLHTHVDIPAESAESEKKLGDEENVAVSGKMMGVEKPKRKSRACQKAPKPPRHPRAHSLDASDHKFIHEISKIAMLEKMRMERMRALKKIKNTKASSSKSNIWALAITILFCLVIFWQGLSPKSHSDLQFEGSREASSTRTRGGFISAQEFRDASPNDSVSTYASISRPVSGAASNGDEDASRTAG